MAEKPKEKFSKYQLVTSEDTFTSQTAQSELVSRRIQSLIPSLAGDLTREAATPKLITTALPSAVGSLFEFDYNDANGNVARHYYAATSTSLYEITLGASGAPGTTALITAFSLSGYPQAVNVDNRLHLSDGTNNYINCDGGLFSWILEGFPIPPASMVPAIDTSAAGTLSVLSNRFYWWTWADETANRVHESSSSSISAGTGLISNKTVRVFQQAGTLATTNGSANIVGTGTAFDQTYVGKYVWHSGIFKGIIATVTDATHIVMDRISVATASGINFVVGTQRMTHWHVYASESENSQVGKYLASVSILTPYYDDQSPFLGSANSLFQNTDRPLRNDPPVASQILEVHKYRIFRRRETKPNFWLFSAKEEVESLDNGAPSESYPGTDSNTLSDIVDEFSYPDESNRIRGMKSYNDALYIATEKQCMPLYGESFDDFSLSQVTQFSVGWAGRFASAATPYGLAFVSYDLKVFLYPAVAPASGVNLTATLIEIGRPLRKKLEQIKQSDLDNVRLLFYNYGRRNWLLLSYQDNASVYHAWVFDFETKGWFELQRGYTSLGVFEIALGKRILVGGTSDGNIYVLDDLSGVYTSNAPLPTGTFRTALIDFGDPDSYHVFRSIEYETTNTNMNVTVTFWLDPPDVDNPGTGRTITTAPARLNPNLRRGFAIGGSTCKRLLIELSVASDTNAGAIRGLKITAEKATGLIA